MAQSNAYDPCDIPTNYLHRLGIPIFNNLPFSNHFRFSIVNYCTSQTLKSDVHISYFDIWTNSTLLFIYTLIFSVPVWIRKHLIVSWRMVYFFMISGPTLSPVCSLWAVWEPSQYGNFFERQHRQNTFLSPISSKSTVSTTLGLSFWMLRLTLDFSSSFLHLLRWASGHRAW